ncbi:Glutamate transport ATP-binding protein GluA [Chlamydiales bacterium STE3]|nr:Glutamate transport ATP-binding protein GluA [Chlamydiales bacterium STE3]
MKLEFEGLSKVFEKHSILNNLTLMIPDAQAIGIIGPSGSGKSTLLRVLAGLEFPTCGKIYLDDKEILYQEKFLRGHRRQLGIVFQSFNLFPHLTALENICLPLIKVHRIPKEEAEEKALGLLKRFGMTKHALKRPSALSGGQSQRVAIIRAIATNPTILLLDEPTSALDPFMTVEVLDLILELKQEMKQLIIVTHHLQFVKRATDYIVFIDEGKIEEATVTSTFFNHPKSDIAKNYLNEILKY